MQGYEEGAELVEEPLINVDDDGTAIPDQKPEPFAHKETRKKTQTDRNRGKRRRDAEEEHGARLQLKKQRRDLDRLSDFAKEIAHEDVLHKARAIRKAVTKAEKALTEPPKLGKQKFQPANIQVTPPRVIRFTQEKGLYNN